ncbi:hypothetical protein B0E46_15630 [Rhodanobacter sp. B04]|uniref:hypothetical protein n=1 Tax=Rhodanobacter sp. B04 TaxID=1945860 RepID=UPI0009D37652|nr:hypothetical protein [Rhodanobacter sp. B04]OOG61408.1 hypothetical protein B0E46_15630 [Rhodanobacter sp. B04]
MMPYVVVVAGLGRCGTSLTMQMLHAAGFPCVGEAPAFEDAATQHRVEPAWFSEQAGKAVKILDPQRVGIPRSALTAVIWLDRDPEQQAKSQCKFVEMLGYGFNNRSAQRRCMKQLALDRATARGTFAGRNTLDLRFEDLIVSPGTAAARIAMFLEPWKSLDVATMKAVVRKRDVKCAPDMSIELSLIDGIRVGATA